VVLIVWNVGIDVVWIFEVRAEGIWKTPQLFSVVFWLSSVVTGDEMGEGLCGASRRDKSDVLMSAGMARAGGSQDGVRAYTRGSS
jgi:hypothetical protein